MIINTTLSTNIYIYIYIHTHTHSTSQVVDAECTKYHYGVAENTSNNEIVPNANRLHSESTVPLCIFSGHSSTANKS